LFVSFVWRGRRAKNKLGLSTEHYLILITPNYNIITFQHYHVTQRLVGQDRGRSETGLVIRPRSQTPRLLIIVPDPVIFILDIGLIRHNKQFVLRGGIQRGLQ